MWIFFWGALNNGFMVLAPGFLRTGFGFLPKVWFETARLTLLFQVGGSLTRRFRREGESPEASHRKWWNASQTKVFHRSRRRFFFFFSLPFFHRNQSKHGQKISSAQRLRIAWQHFLHGPEPGSWVSAEEPKPLLSGKRLDLFSDEKSIKNPPKTWKVEKNKQTKKRSSENWLSSGNKPWRFNPGSSAKSSTFFNYSLVNDHKPPCHHKPHPFQTRFSQTPPGKRRVQTLLGQQKVD